MYKLWYFVAFYTVLLQNLFFLAIFAVLSHDRFLRFTRYYVEKNLAKNSARGEKMTNMRYVLGALMQKGKCQFKKPYCAFYPVFNKKWIIALGNLKQSVDTIFPELCRSFDDHQFGDPSPSFFPIKPSNKLINQFKSEKDILREKLATPHSTPPTPGSPRKHNHGKFFFWPLDGNKYSWFCMDLYYF